MKEFEVKTLNNQFVIKICSDFIDKKYVKIDKALFNKMCKDGCVNYSKKYSCPPFAPSFYDVVGNFEGLFIMLFLCKLNQINSTEYNKVRIANVIMKSKIEKLMRFLEGKFGSIYLSTGSCRLCNPCKCKLGEPCEHPKKRRYSLEAVGIDCNKLVRDLFGLSLLWYKNKQAPEYTCVICGLLCNKGDKEKLEEELSQFLPSNSRTSMPFSSS